MSPINQEAIQDLNIAVQVLMPDSASPGVEVISTVSVQRISPTGLGGFIELNPEGNANILGRRLSAVLSVLLQGNNLANLQETADSVIEAFMGADRKTLLDNGILAIEQIDCAYRLPSGANREIELNFKLIYEYKQIPEETQEIIAEIPIHLDNL